MLVERPVRAGVLRRLRPTVRGLAVAASLTVVLGTTLAATAGAAPGLGDGTAAGSTQVTAGAEGQTKVLVAGDSVAFSLAYRFDPQAHPDYAVSSTTLLGCGVGIQQIVVGTVVTRRQPQCHSWPAQWRQAVTDSDPDVAVLVVSAWDVYDHRVAGRTLRVGTPEYARYLGGRLQRAVGILGAGGRPVVIVNSGCYAQQPFAPEGADLAPDRNDPVRGQAVNAVVADLVAGHGRHVSVADLRDRTCPGGRYQRVVNGVELREDGVHFSEDGAALVWDWLLPLLRARTASRR
jgi:hypothetical protein